MATGWWRLDDPARDVVVASRVALATSFWARFRGLMGRPSLSDGEGLYLATASIHMLFMRFPIDALFLAPTDEEGLRRVVALRQGLPAWRGLVLPVRGAEGVVELPAGTLSAAGVRLGDRLRLGPNGT
ncbi:DUF192 domain-containing protein [soil metagenome]